MTIVPRPRRQVRRMIAATGLSLLFMAAAPAFAEDPENLEGLGPERGEWELEYSGQFGDANGSDDERQHSVEAYYGVTDWLALGGETQASYKSGPLVRKDRLYLDYGSAIAVLRFSDAERDPVGIGLWLQAGLDSDGELAIVEARLIAEKKSDRWWAQANVMLRRVNEGEQEGAFIAYAGRLSHALGPATWLGLEASGQAVKLHGFAREELDKAHYLGPSLTHEFSLRGDREFELGASYLRRLDSHRGLRGVLQVSAALTF